MATLPLFHPPPTVNAWHEVISPGGYEWWRFDADDRQRDFQVIVTFFQGSPFSREYRRAYDRYRRSPTRHAPPVPADWAYVGLVVLRRGKVLAREMIPFYASQFSAARQGLSVATGGNTIQRIASSGAYRVHVESPRCRLQMTLDPIIQPPIEERPFAADEARARHRWIVAAPLCRVVGTLEPLSAGASGGEAIAFDGLGYHDHNYGTAPLREAARQVFLCRLLSENRAILLRITRSREPSRADDVVLLDISRDGTRERPITAAAIEWSAARPFRSRRLASLVAPELSMRHRETLLSSHPYSRLTYDLTTDDIQGIAVAELISP